MKAEKVCSQRNVSLEVIEMEVTANALVRKHPLAFQPRAARVPRYRSKHESIIAFKTRRHYLLFLCCWWRTWYASQPWAVARTDIALVNKAFDFRQLGLLLMITRLSWWRVLALLERKILSPAKLIIQWAVLERKLVIVRKLKRETITSLQRVEPGIASWYGKRYVRSRSSRSHGPETAQIERCSTSRQSTRKDIDSPKPPLAFARKGKSAT